MRLRDSDEKMQLRFWLQGFVFVSTLPPLKIVATFWRALASETGDIWEQKQFPAEHVPWKTQPEERANVSAFLWEETKASKTERRKLSLSPPERKIDSLQ